MRCPTVKKGPVPPNVICTFGKKRSKLTS